MDKKQQLIKDNKNRIQDGLKSKKFEARNSIIHDLLNNDVNIQGFYNMGFIIVIFWQLGNLLDSYLTYDRLSINVELIQMSFSKPFLLMYIWVYIFLASFIPYAGFVLWAIIRFKINKSLVAFFDRLSLCIFILYFAMYTYYFSLLIRQNDFPPVSSLTLILELVRLEMKFYAFVRSNVPRTITFKYHDHDGIMYPGVSNYIYFLFAPTLIYQDDYPRSKTIQWKKVIRHLINFIGCLLLLNVIFKPVVTEIEIFSRNSFNWFNFLVLVLRLIPHTLMWFLTGFSLFFECWLNAFAEMLRFSDRSFNKNFWASTSFERFFSTWNGIVHDWLYFYIYKDFYEIVSPNNKIVARVMVFFVSGIYHEFILGFTFNILSPYMFLVFSCFGIALKIITFNNANANFLFLLSTGFIFSLLSCAYGTHYYIQYERNK